MAFNQDIRAVTDNGTIRPVYLAYWFLANEERMLGIATEATHGTKRLDMGDVRRQRISVPGLAEQDAIIEVLDAHDARIRAEEAYLDKLKLQKKGLMHDLLTGRVRVKV